MAKRKSWFAKNKVFLVGASIIFVFILSLFYESGSLWRVEGCAADKVIWFKDAVGQCNWGWYDDDLGCGLCGEVCPVQTFPTQAACIASSG